MSLTFVSYWPMVLLLLIPCLWWIRKQTVTDLSPGHLKLSTGLRSFIIAALVFSLMQPVLYRPGADLSVVYLLDLSQSVSAPAIQAAIDWIGKTNQEGQPTHSGIVAFAANSMYFEDLEQLRKVPISTRPVPGSINQSATNIEEAIDRGLRNLAPHHVKRLVLLTDGNENSRKMIQMAPRLRDDGVKVFTVPLQTRTTRDVWVETILVPLQVTAEETFPLEVHAYSQVETSCEITLKNGTRTLDTRRVQLTPGLNRVSFEPRIDQGGAVTLEASLNVANDPFPDNNVYRESVNVIGKPRVLYVEGYEPSVRYLRDALTQEGLTVDVVPALGIPSTVEELDRYDAVILSDVDRNRLIDSQMQALASYVGDLGGGFILAGGENNYGEGGYSDTLVESILPITFEAKKEDPGDVAMIVVLDKSGSMGGQRIEMAKEATKAPLQFLKDTDKFGVIAFDYEMFVQVPLAPAINRIAMEAAISRIIASGETNIYPALDEAYKQLKDDPAKVKHIVVLSDGRSLPDEFEKLTKEIAENKITVSSVAVGEQADKELMENIANWGGGRTYYVVDPSRVPLVFSKEAEEATGRSIRETPFKPVIKKTIEAFKGIDIEAAPNLLGYVAATAKDTSEVIMQSDDAEEPEPVLARWQYGLGKSVAFMSDVKDRWSAEWLTWNGYSKFWSQLVRETMRRRDDQEFDLRVIREDDVAWITINAVAREGTFRNKLQAQLRVVEPDQTVVEIDVPQVGPGFYQTRVPLTKEGTYLFRAIGPQNGTTARVLAYSYPEEYHFYPTNVDGLRSISETTGGVFQAGAERIFNLEGETVAVPSPLWQYFTVFGLILFLADVLLRRFRLFLN